MCLSNVEKSVLDDEKIKDIFYNHFDCYTEQININAIATEKPAMSIDKFIEVINKYFIKNK